MSKLKLLLPTLCLAFVATAAISSAQAEDTTVKSQIPSLTYYYFDG